MLWPSLRARRSNNNLRRNSTVEPTSDIRPSQQISRNGASVELLSPYSRPSTPVISRRNDSSRPPSSQAGRLSASDELPDHDGPQISTAKQKRFSMLRFRNASEPHLFSRAKQQAGVTDASAPPVPNLNTSTFHREMTSNSATTDMPTEF